jgi:hypothetical protein
MSTNWMIWPGHPGPSLVIWVALAMMALYLARVPAHRAIRAGARVLTHAMRLSARSLVHAQERLSERNRDVLLTLGEQTVENEIGRELQRVRTVVARDLAAYPELHRILSDQITHIDEDYRRATDTPPSPPSWLRSLELMKGLVAQGGGDSVVVDVLKAMEHNLEKNHREAMAEYRAQSAKRHGILTRMMPFWRKVTGTLEHVNSTVRGLEDRSAHIDEQMARYTEMRSRSQKAVRMLGASQLTQFFIAGLVLVIATLGGFINFQLIALPMSEMVGGASHLGSFKTSDVAALVIIMVEIAMGLFLMESLRITHMFPVIGVMDDRMRRRMIIVTLSILGILACVEASLAYMRDLLATDHEALTQALAGIEASQPEFRWIPSVGQMVMGFILPFALTFVAIPLESFVHASRTVLGVMSEALLKALAFCCRLMGNVAQQAGSVLVTVYDLTIFVPLRVERWVAASAESKALTRAKASTRTP